AAHADGAVRVTDAAIGVGLCRRVTLLAGFLLENTVAATDDFALVRAAIKLEARRKVSSVALFTHVHVANVVAAGAVRSARTVAGRPSVGCRWVANFVEVV